MRRPHLPLVLATLGAAPALALDDLKVPDPGFDQPELEAEGDVERIALPDDLGHAVRIGDEGRLTRRFPVSGAPKPEHFPSGTWYGLVSLDLMSVTGGRGWLEVDVLVEGVDEPVASSRTRIEGDRSAGRQHLHVASEAFVRMEGRTVLLQVAVEGPIEALVDDLAFVRFPQTLTRKWLGKANGPHGPDLLASGALGFHAIVEDGHAAFPILSVVEGGPAARAGLEPGDLVVGIDGEPLGRGSLKPGWAWFHHGHEARLGRAIEAALRARERKLTLEVLRGDTIVELSLALPFTKRLTDGFPLEGKLAEQLRADLVAWAVRHQREDGGWPGTDAVNPALGGLALLSTRDRRHADAIERTVDFLLTKHPKPSEMRGLAYWTIAFQGMFFCEYYLASNDERVLPWIEEAIEWLPTTTHECKWGMQAFGHGPDGLPYDDKALMAPAAHLCVFDALARLCGVEARVWEHIEPYVVHSWSDPAIGDGHGAMGYNASYKDLGEFWSRSGLIALATALRGEHGTMRERLCVIMAERHPWMLNSHAYGEPGGALGLVGLAVAHRPSFDEVIAQWRWKFLNAWEPGYGLRYTTAHMGAPYMGEDVIVNLGYTLVTSVASGGLVMTGGTPDRWLP